MNKYTVSRVTLGGTIKLTKESKLFLLEIIRSGEVTTDQVTKIMELLKHPQINVFMDGRNISLDIGKRGNQ